MFEELWGFGNLLHNFDITLRNLFRLIDQKSSEKGQLIISAIFAGKINCF